MNYAESRTAPRKTIATYLYRAGTGLNIQQRQNLSNSHKAPNQTCCAKSQHISFSDWPETNSFFEGNQEL